MFSIAAKKKYSIVPLHPRNDRLGRALQGLRPNNSTWLRSTCDIGVLMLMSLTLIWLTGCGSNADSAATVAAAPQVTLSSNPTAVMMGQSSTLTWQATNALSCNASGAWSGNLATSGSMSTGQLSSDANYTLTCNGPGGSGSQSTTVRVMAPTPTVTISAQPATITAGGSSTLTWNSTNAANCTAAGGWTASNEINGAQVVGPLANTTEFSLTCIGVGGSASQSATVTVTAAGPTVALSVQPSTIASGSASTLNWASTNASSCMASGGWSGIETTSGSQSTGALTATRTYTLTCNGPGGTAVQSATVTVTAPAAPTVSIAANPSTVASGSASTLTWFRPT